MTSCSKLRVKEFRIFCSHCLPYYFSATKKTYVKQYILDTLMILIETVITTRFGAQQITKQQKTHYFLKYLTVEHKNRSHLFFNKWYSMFLW